MKRTLAAVTVSLLGLQACSDQAAVSTTTEGPAKRPVAKADRTMSMPRKGGFGSSRLQFFEGCPDLLAQLKALALERVTAWGLWGRNWYPYPNMRGGVMFDMAAAETTASGSDGAGSSTGVPNFSGTNTQEIGVDEGDIVETNGTTVFVVSNDKVRAVDVASSTVVSLLDVPAGTQQLILDGQRLLVVTQPWSGNIESVVSVFDVADASKPSLLVRSHLEGTVVATRAIDGRARLVLTTMMATRLPFVSPAQFGYDETTAKAENERIIRESTIDDWMPRMFDESQSGTFGPMGTSLDCTNVATPSVFAGMGVTWIASVDMRGDALPVGTAGVVSYGDTVYASPDNIYVATQAWDWYNPESSSRNVTSPPPTQVHQFSLQDDGGASYVASGEFQGRLLNQFSMSELDGDLRVAATVDDYSGNGKSESFVRVLRPQGSQLVEIGTVGGLGLTEQIQSVRFLGSQGYVVTFRQTDPLYVIDLSVPTAPRMVGELKIPGYSAYLHPVGEGLLLGVGQSATDDGVLTGTQLALFDVSDPANPQQIAVLPIGGRSDAEWDHHAFLYWPEDGTIVLPTSPGWGTCPALVACPASMVPNNASGVIVAQLKDRTLSLKGGVVHQTSSTSGCWNPLQRSMVIGDELVTIGLDQMKFSDLGTLAPKRDVKWGTADEYGCYWYG
ncbi:MAG: beta-propeller domain-containing protein [Acidobacteria bacterium]|nr:beta-propeller domain-containing protein [Acidobacteriota bacterium]